MEPESKLKKVFLSLPFVWILTTGIYLGLQLLKLPWIARWLGFVVPIGAYNYFMLAGAWTEAPIILVSVCILVILTIIGGEWLLLKMNMRSITKLLVILLILFVLTIAVDLIIWHQWQTLEFFKEGGVVKFGF